MNRLTHFVVQVALVLVRTLLPKLLSQHFQGEDDVILLDAVGRLDGLGGEEGGVHEAEEALTTVHLEDEREILLGLNVFQSVVQLWLCYGSLEVFIMIL